MCQPELFLEFKRATSPSGGRTRHHRITAKRKLFVIGSSRDADLRLWQGPGQAEILGCHAVLQYVSGNWVLQNLAVEGAEVLVNGLPVIEAILDAETKIEIAGHHIELFSRRRV